MKVVINQSDMSEVKAAMAGIKNGTERVLTSAINSTVKTMKVQTRVRLGNTLNLKASRIEKDLKTVKASFGHLSGAVIAKGRPVGLVSYGAKETAKGVKVRIYRDRKIALLKHAFIAEGKRGQNPGDGVNTHVFWRKWKGARKPNNPNRNYAAMPDKFRYKVQTRRGPRIEDVLAKDKVLGPLQTQAAHIFALNVDKGILDVLRRFG